MNANKKFLINLCAIISFLSIQNLYPLEQIKKWVPRIAGVAAIGYTVFRVNQYFKTLTELNKAKLLELDLNQEKIVLADMVIRQANAFYSKEEKKGVPWAPLKKKINRTHPKLPWSQLSDDEKMHVVTAGIYNGSFYFGLTQHKPAIDHLNDPRKNMSCGQRLLLTTVTPSIKSTNSRWERNLAEPTPQKTSTKKHVSFEESANASG